MAFNGAFFPGAVGVAVVDGNMEEVFEGVFVEELGAVVGEDGFELVAAGTEVAPEAAERSSDGGLRDGREEVHVETAGGGGIAAVGVDEREHPAAAASGVDGVHLEVAGFEVVAGGGREFVDHMLGGVVARVVRGGRFVERSLVAFVGERFTVFVEKFASL